MERLKMVWAVAHAFFVLRRNRYCVVHLKPLKVEIDPWDYQEYFCPDCVAARDLLRKARLFWAVSTMRAYYRLHGIEIEAADAD